MLIQTRQGFESAKEVLLAADVIAVDTETTGLAWEQGDWLIGVSTYCEVELTGVEGKTGIGFYFPFRHNPDTTIFPPDTNLPEEWLEDLAICLQRSEVTYIWHNAKFDFHIFRRESINPSSSFYDTMLLSHMSNENQSHALKRLGEKYFGSEAAQEETAIKKVAKALGSWDKIPSTIMHDYAVKDAKLTYAIWIELMKEIEQQELLDLWPNEEEFCMCLLAMEKRGVRINGEQARQLSIAAEKRMGEIKQTLGFDPAKTSEVAAKLFKSPPENLGFVPGVLSLRKNKDFPGGVPVVDEATISQYKCKEVDLVLEFRGLQKANSTWYAGFLEKLGEDGRLHTTYKQHGTVTTRLSSENPNMQQLPRKIEESPVRSLIIPDNGYQLYYCDYSQVELRLAAVYCNEEAMLEAFKEGADIHQFTADSVNVERFMGKTLNFAMIYGAGARKLAELLNVSQTESKKILDRFHEQFPGFRRLSEKAQNAAALRGYVKLWTGRRLHLSDSPDNPWKMRPTHKAFNGIIQGGAAEIMKHTMLKFHRLQPVDYNMLLQIHDALLFNIKEDAVEVSLKEIKKEMEEWVEERFKLPFPVDAVRWG